MKRRRFLETMAAYTALPLVGESQPAPAITRAIPSSNERIPVIGMGTWQTFDVGRSAEGRARQRGVLQEFFGLGGRLIDSSPMYGSSEPVVGDLLGQMNPRVAPFAASKVWVPGKRLGVIQMEASRKQWGIPRFDLLAVHNLLDWQAHLATLREMKAKGQVRYIGVTTSHGRRHDLLEEIMRSQRLDFVQFTYNLADRSAEERLLQLARDRKIAVMINRPLDGGELFDRVRGKPLPGWAAESGIHNWAQFFLKFVVSHPAVTCAIPATTQRAHVTENIGAGVGRMPDAALRVRMVEYFRTL